MHRLITIPISHYCEKARWALELADMAYREDAHLQVLHYLPVRFAGGGITVPVLVTDDGAVLAESSDILKWVDEQAQLGLYPEDPLVRREVEEFEARLDVVLGASSRLWMYQHLLEHRHLAERYGVTGVPKWQQWGLRAMFPPVAWFIRKRFTITAESAQQSLEAAHEQMEMVAARLESGGPFLFGDRFTAADLSFACMATPLLLPEEYGVPLPLLDELPKALSDVVANYRKHPAGKFALKMFREQRPPPARLRA